jgi:hypothetical protein
LHLLHTVDWGAFDRNGRSTPSLREASATKQSRPYPSASGLLRGACARTAQSADPSARNDVIHGEDRLSHTVTARFTQPGLTALLR